MSVYLAFLLFLSTLAIASAPTSTTSYPDVRWTNGESGETPKRLLTVPDSVRSWVLGISTLSLTILFSLIVYKLRGESSFNRFMLLLETFLIVLIPIFEQSKSSTNGLFPQREMIFFSFICYFMSIAVMLGIGVAMKQSWKVVAASLATFLCGTITYRSLSETALMRGAFNLSLLMTFSGQLNLQWPYLMNILPVPITILNVLNVTDDIFIKLTVDQSLLRVLPSTVVAILTIFLCQPAFEAAMVGRYRYTIENRQEVTKFQVGFAVCHILLMVSAYLMALVYTPYLQ